MGQHPDKIPMTIQLAKAMTLTRTLPRSFATKHVIKDTISIPSKGYTIFRFKADNPGWWLLHCHFGKNTVSFENVIKWIKPISTHRVAFSSGDGTDFSGRPDFSDG